MKKLLFLALLVPVFFSWSNETVRDLANKRMPGKSSALKPETSFPPDSLFRDAYRFFEHLRAPTGVYRDATRLEGNQFHPASTGSTAMGLLSLAVADAKGWNMQADSLVLATLKAMLGLRPGFRPDRNKTGYFRHFIDLETGEQAWNSEYSTIDTGILVAAALFCKRHFATNDSIGILADALYRSVDWGSAIQEVESGGIFLMQDEYGQGSGITLPFNEYMIVAWLARHELPHNPDAISLWNKHYAVTDSLPKTNYQGIEVLTDFPGNILSGFVPQFTYYLCHAFTTDSAYLGFMNNAMRVDTLSWRTSTTAPRYVWGFGAGSSCEWVSSGYHADNCFNHPGTLCSPHIMAGNIPINPMVKQDLEVLAEDSLGLYFLQDTSEIAVLWRFSTEDTSWQACDVQGVDYATMLLGLAAHPDELGSTFFETNNDFSFPDSSYLNSAPVLQSATPFCMHADSVNRIEVCKWVTDWDDPTTRLHWEFSMPDSVSLSWDSTTRTLTCSPLHGFRGADSIRVIVWDRNQARDTTWWLLSFSDPCWAASGIETLTVDSINVDLQSFPNPFGQSTRIPFYLSENGAVLMTIIDPRGAQVKQKQIDYLIAGTYTWQWDGTDENAGPVPDGVYFCLIEINGMQISKKLILRR